MPSRAACHINFVATMTDVTAPGRRQLCEKHNWSNGEANADGATRTSVGIAAWKGKRDLVDSRIAPSPKAQPW